MSKIQIDAFFDSATFTISYVVFDKATKTAAIIDSVLDYDAASGRTSKDSANKLIEHVKALQLSVKWILESHAHADHLSAAPYLKQQLGGSIAIGALITDVQKVFSKIYNFEPEFESNGNQFDRLLIDGEQIALGESFIKVMHTPGHTPACLTYLIEDAAFVGDTLFMPDFGTARTDFPGGDAVTLFNSIQKILSLPDTTRVFTGHDYMAEGRDFYAWESTVAEQKAKNIHINQSVSEEQFVAFREKRDAGLSLPKLILPSVQVNIRAGHLPPKESNGVSYLKIPVDAV
jgi:glyoxylase-like metal-dependent hydrolase (beta-lactamase superfamily II)